MALSCTKNDNISSQRPIRLMVAKDDGAPQTKTSIITPTLPESLTDPGRTVQWLEGDKIAIYDTEKHLFTTDVTGQKVGVSNADGYELSDAVSYYYGVYPYSAFLGMTGTNIRSTIPVNQHIEGTENWDPDAPVLVGSYNVASPTEKDVMRFVNAHALVELNFPAAASSVTIDAGTALSGDFSTTAEGSITPASENTSRYVSLAGTLSPNTPYYLASLPKDEAKDVKIFVTYTGTGGKISQSGLHYYDLTDLTPGIAFPANKITFLNLEKVEPTKRLGEPASDFKPKGTYLFVGPDGSCVWVKSKNGFDFKFEDLHSTIYWTDSGINDLMITGSNVSGGTHTMEITPDPDCYSL